MNNFPSGESNAKQWQHARDQATQARSRGKRPRRKKLPDYDEVIEGQMDLVEEIERAEEQE